MTTVRDSDISLWLHNKLGTSNDSWTSGSICSQLNSEVLRNIKDCFPELQTQVKLKLLLSFFHIPRRCIEEWRNELDEIIEVAHVDSELWVSMLSEIMKTFSASGQLNLSIQDNEINKRMFSDLISDLKKLVRKQPESSILPLECHYLNKSALNSIVRQQPVPVKHFNLKKKPKSSVLRQELLQKSADASANLKKSSTPTVPLRSRGMPRKMTDTTPLKGIPSRLPSGGFQSPVTNRSGIPRTPTPRKDGGIKIIDINEQPMAYQQKKRKKQQELEEAAAAAAAGAATQIVTSPTTNNKKPCVDIGTPDYALGLAPPPTPGGILPPPTPGALPTPCPIEMPPTPSYVPPMTPSIPPQSVLPAILEPPPTPGGGVLTTLLPPAQIIPQIITTPIQPTETIHHLEPVEQRVIKPVITIPKPQEERKFLLSREHFVEAQEIFRTANKVTRPEKALILGFMAGLRDNPCPDLGNVITIKLSEDKSDELANTIVENHFQMNYDTGEWNVIVKYRECHT